MPTHWLLLAAILVLTMGGDDSLACDATTLWARIRLDPILAHQYRFDGAAGVARTIAYLQSSTVATSQFGISANSVFTTATCATALNDTAAALAQSYLLLRTKTFYESATGNCPDGEFPIADLATQQVDCVAYPGNAIAIATTSSSVAEILALVGLIAMPSLLLIGFVVLSIQSACLNASITGLAPDDDAAANDTL